MPRTIFRSGVPRLSTRRTRFPIPEKWSSFPRSDADSQAFLVSQMRLNDELA